MAKTFKSLEALVNHYKHKVTIPSKFHVEIDGIMHTFRSRHSVCRVRMLKGTTDYYEFQSDNIFEVKILLKFRYLRHFEEKELVEVYFTFTDQNKIDYLSPIYFNNRFVIEDEFKPWEYGLSDVPKQWINRPWIIEHITLDPFKDARTEAYLEVWNNVFYGSMYPPFEDDDPEIIKQLKIDSFRKKWAITDFGSHRGNYFHSKDTSIVPDYW